VFALHIVDSCIRTPLDEWLSTSRYSFIFSHQNCFILSNQTLGGLSHESSFI